MSAPTNAAETMPIARPIPLDREIDLGTLTQQLMDVQVKNTRIVQKKRDQEAQEEEEKEEEEKKDEVDRLAREAKKKTEKAPKWVSAILSLAWSS